MSTVPAGADKFRPSMDEKKRRELLTVDCGNGPLRGRASNGGARARGALALDALESIPLVIKFVLAVDNGGVEPEQKDDKRREKTRTVRACQFCQGLED